ncbi:ParA family protein [Halocatena marina]|uniref:ParA family protein n=1 Tax=Halocatena marina TaxID=2934937 RepID=A0ABD5YYB5_9EURY
MNPLTSKNGVVAVCILKGGMGKSTIAINLAHRLQENHGETVYIDVDKNGHGTEFLGFGDAYKANGQLEEVIFRDEHPADLVIETEWDFGVVASSSEMSTINDRMKNQMNADVILKNKVIDPLREDGYDYVVLDALVIPRKWLITRWLPHRVLSFRSSLGREASVALNESWKTRSSLSLRQRMELLIFSLSHRIC